MRVLRGRVLAPGLALFFLLGAFARAENLRITVYHTNDIHGWIMSRPASFRGANAGRSIGGAAALASLVRKDKGPKLLLDAGDWFQGTPEGSLSKGESLVEILNALGYDATVAGNHDFDFGEARLKELVRGMRMPVLGANVYRQKDKKRADYLKPWIIKEVSGVKVGLFGLLTTNMRNLTFPENYAGLEFRREVDEARDAVKALRQAGATVIIALTHVGFEKPEMGSFEGDRTLASSVEGIDLIVGGHTHTPVNPALKDATHGTLIAQAGSYLTAAGQAVLEIDPKTKRVVSSSGRLIELWIDETGEDPEVLKLVRTHAEAVGRTYDVVVATASASLMRNRDGESSLGDWMTDCSRDWAKADLAFQNSGGIRADMNAGPLTLRHLFNIMPFDNYVVKLQMSGRLVGEVLDHGVGKGQGIVQVSGTSFRYDRDRDRGRRVSEVLVGGKPLDPGASYSVATIDFLVKGGDGYSPFDLAEKKEFTRVLMRDVMRWCAEKNPLIPPPAGGRMREESRGAQKLPR